MVIHCSTKRFVHCSDCTDVSGKASDNEDKYIDSVFDMSSYVDETEVKLKFIVVYRYQYSGDGEHWFIGSLTFAGTGMESVAFEEIVSISGASGPFLSGERYHIQRIITSKFRRIKLNSLHG